MRSFVALMTCIGCIAWIHSCEKRLLGVRLERNSITPDYQPQQLPVAILPATVPAHYISRVSDKTITPAPLVALHPRSRAKKQSGKQEHPVTDSLLFNLAVVKGKYSIYNNTTP